MLINYFTRLEKLSVLRTQPPRLGPAVHKTMCCAGCTRQREDREDGEWRDFVI